MKGKHHTIHTEVKHHSMKHHAGKHHRKHGGRLGGPEHGDIAHDDTPKEVYAGAGSDVVKEASKKKRGGAAKHHMKHVMAEGHMSKHRLDRPARKHGGGVGAEMRPLSAAANVKTPAGRDVDADYD
jgi:hypothetical protein